MGRVGMHVGWTSVEKRKTKPVMSSLCFLGPRVPDAKAPASLEHRPGSLMHPHCCRRCWGPYPASWDRQGPSAGLHSAISLSHRCPSLGSPICAFPMIFGVILGPPPPQGWGKMLVA